MNSENFIIRGLDPHPFEKYFEFTEDELQASHIKKITVDQAHAFPCRIELKDALPGEKVLLLNYEHQFAPSPYRANGPIYIKLGAIPYLEKANFVPEQLQRRLLSLRAYDREDMMIEAETVEGKKLSQLVRQFFSNQNVSYIHAHNARPGCFACRIDRC